MKPKVLVVDDDQPFANALSRWLSDLGYQPVVAGWGAQGLALLERGGFDALLLDLRLPDISGHDVIRQLKRIGVTVPIIVVSGTRELDDLVHVWRENAADFLRKPFRIEELSAALERAIAGSPRRSATAGHTSSATAGPSLEETSSQPWDLLDSAPDAMVVVDTAGLIRFVNAQTERVFGYSRWALTGMPIETLLPVHRRAVHGQHLARYFSDPTVRPMGAGRELEGLRANGEVFPLEIALSPVRYGGSLMAIAAVRDVTARKRVEEDLRRSHEDLTITLESIGDGVIVADPEGRVVRMNPVAETLTGWPAEEAAGRGIDEVFRIVHDQTREPVENAVQRVLRDGRGVGLNNHSILFARNGGERPIADSCAPMRAAEGELLRGVVLVFRDNTAEAAEQQALRDTARMQGQLDCTPITVVRLDRHARITHVNEAWRKFARENGADDETIDGIGLDYVAAARRVCEEGAAAVAEALSEMVVGRKESLSCVYPCHSPTEVRWFRLDAKRVAADDAVVLIHTNITDHHLAEARLRVQSVVAQALAERAPLLESCRRVIQATCEGLEWDFAAIWMPGNGERLRCAECWARPGFAAPALEHATRTAEFERGRGLPGRVWADCTPEWIQDITADSNFPREPSATAAGLRSGFGVPLGAEGEVFAVVEFFSRIEREFDPALLELLTTAGAQLGALVLRERAELRAAEAEAARRSVRSTLDAVVACAPVFIVVLDEGGRVQFVNRTVTHREKDEIIGSDFLQYLPPGDREQHQARLRRVVETGVLETYEATVAGPDGKTLWLSSHMGPLRQGDRIVGAVVVSRDVTDLKQTQTEFAAAQRLAAVGTLAAGVAHEINTPVQFVSDSVHFLRDAARDVFGFVEKLQEVRRLAADGAPVAELQEAIAVAAEGEEEADLAYLHENVPKAFERCVDGLERVSTIVRSMKEFAHPAQHEMAPIDLNRAIRNTLTIARAEYKYVADLETELGELPPVTCYINDINQVVLNLVVNAAHAVGDVVKGRDEKGSIRVRTRQDGNHAVISIGDTGTGIPEAVAPHVFEPFFTTKEVGKGTGQGLALAWGVVTEKHGGELTFESKLGEGTTFFIRLPIAGKAATFGGKNEADTLRR